ncbi:hypothetical protein GTO91_03070 [Heliobacterium undosum]|uniref:Uncharacterized protein n=1 Tax=Heliomicrobium undosum TaxID=121734 RepID=A0A845L2H2_9FIRM|nr:hypothetical protein [Heliomicrobium undosum]MZP28700.1 hypothetical protein [Heliomicrobium undosum]
MLQSTIRVQLRDGLVIEGNTFDDVVRNLWTDSWDNSSTVEDFMAAVQQRVILQTGREISFSDCESFLRELQRLCLVTAIDWIPIH